MEAVFSYHHHSMLDCLRRILDLDCFTVDQYIDSAVVAGVHQATVIHGKGTGALRNYLHNQFKHDKRVKSFRVGAYGEGDFGVTVLEL